MIIHLVTKPIHGLTIEDLQFLSLISFLLQNYKISINASAEIFAKFTLNKSSISNPFAQKPPVVAPSDIFATHAFEMRGVELAVDEIEVFSCKVLA